MEALIVPIAMIVIWLFASRRKESGKDQFDPEAFRIEEPPPPDPDPSTEMMVDGVHDATSIYYPVFNPGPGEDRN